MPSLRTVITGTLALLQIVSASPVPQDITADCIKAAFPTPTVPLSGDATELPTTNLTLQYVAIGRGIQNYSCSAAGATAAALGAVATLYDATAIAYASTTALNTIPGLAVNTPPTADGAYVLPPPYNRLTVLGHHYFAADTTPTFNLSSVGKIMFGKKTGDISAPANASAGPAGTGAVDWLQLVPKPAPYSPSVGLGAVYRVETAGGKPTACTAAGVISVQYSAEYWFFD